MAKQVDEAARHDISGPLKSSLEEEIAAIEGETGQTGHFTLGFGYDPYRKKEARDILVLGYRSVFDTSGGYVEAAVRIEGGARPDPVPAETRQIIPYISNVMTVKPERTFWEPPRRAVSQQSRSDGRCGRDHPFVAQHRRKRARTAARSQVLISQS